MLKEIDLIIRSLENEDRKYFEDVERRIHKDLRPDIYASTVTDYYVNAENRVMMKCPNSKKDVATKYFWTENGFRKDED